MAQLSNDIPPDVPKLWEQYQAWLEEKDVSRPRIVLHGGFGENSFGDDAALDVLIDRVRSRLPQAAITVICPGPGAVERRYSRDQRLRACQLRSPAAVQAIVRSHIYLATGRVDAGGTYSGLALANSLATSWFVGAELAKASGARTCFYGIGASSLVDRTAKLLARRALNDADVVSVRDARSVTVLKAAGVERSILHILDPALSLEPASSEQAESALLYWGARRSKQRRVSIAFHPRRDDSLRGDAKIEAVARLIRHLIDRYQVHVIFLPTSHHPTRRSHDDLDFGRRVRAALPAPSPFTLIEAYYHPRVTMALLGAMDLNIMEPPDAALLASLVGVPFIALSDDEGLMEHVRRMEAEERLVSPEQLLAGNSFDWLDLPLSRMGGFSP